MMTAEQGSLQGPREFTGITLDTCHIFLLLFFFFMQSFSSKLPKVSRIEPLPYRGSSNFTETSKRKL